MKKILLLIICSFFIGCASVPSTINIRKLDHPKQVEIKQDKALVYFFRENAGFTRNILSSNIYDGKNKIGGSTEGCYFLYYANPGDHIFVVEYFNTQKTFLSAKLEVGKIYYIDSGSYQGLINIVPEAMAKEIINEISYCGYAEP